MSAPLVLAHRGLRKEYRENTVLAFEAARLAGCDGVEFDVRGLQDGSLVLHHNPTVRRLGRRKKLDDLTWAALRALGRNLRRIEPLPRALAWAHRYPRQWIDVELKDVGHERDVVRLLRERGRTDRVVLTSFVPAACEAAARVARGIPVGLITLRKESRVVRTAQDLGLQFVVLHETNSTPALLHQANAAGLGAWTWGVRSARSARRLAHLGVSAFITDYPQRLFALRKPAAPALPGRPLAAARRWLRRGRWGS